ncbi:MAG: ABC transporter substrate-binding protein [Anaerolineae bacterium]|nr:ABC transporter substrate-binding protein [Anaerolineae bacterium]
MKTYRWMVYLVLVALIVSGCGGTEKSAPGGGSVDAQGNVTLDFWYALGGDSGEAVEELVRQFNESHPTIQVVATYQGDYTTAMAKVYSAITGDTLPNIAQLGAAPLLGSSGAILPIGDFIAADAEFDAAKIYPAFLEYNTAGGVLWSMPFNNSVPILYYNKDLFLAAGLDPEKPPQNVEELLAAAKALTSEPDASGMPTQWGLNTREDTHWFLSAFFLENGAEIVSQDETSMLYNSPQAVEMLQMWADWVTTQEVMPANQHKEALSDFLAGKLGMLLSSTAVINSVQSGASFSLGTELYPAVGTERKVPLGGGSLVIFENDDERIRDASWQFVKFMVSEQSSSYLSTHTGYIPIYTDAVDWVEIQTMIADNPIRQAVIDSLPYTVSIPVFSALGNSDLALRKAVEQVELGVATPQQALDEAKTSVDHAIETQFQPTP